MSPCWNVIGRERFYPCCGQVGSFEVTQGFAVSFTIHVLEV
jgi:hypothetical protein